MESRASTFFKNLFSAVVAMVKAKTLAAKSKTRTIKLRLLIFRLLRSKKALLKAINHKMHALLVTQEPSEECGSSRQEQPGGAIVLYSAGLGEAPTTTIEAEPSAADDDGDNYPDLTHSMFDLEDEDEDEDGLVSATGSVIDLVRSSRDDGTEFRLEDEIDHVADVFIKRFHRQMRLQTQESFKRHLEMLQSSV